MSELALLDEVSGKVVGEKTGAKAYKKWEPKTWQPVYEAMVALSATGLDNVSIGKRFGYGPQTVSNVINTPQGKALLQIINERVRKANVSTLSERIERMQDAALKHVEFVLDTPSVAFKNPLAIFDRSLSFLKSSGSGSFAGDSGSNNGNVTTITNINKAMILSPQANDMLSEGLAKANQVQVMHDGSIAHNKQLGIGESDG